MTKEPMSCIIILDIKSILRKIRSLMDSKQPSENTYTEQPQYVYTESWMGASANGARQQETDFQQSQPFDQQMWNQQYGASYPAYSPYAAQKATGNGMIGFAIAGMVCGILSIMACAFMVFDLFLAISGLVFSIIAINKKYDGRGMAIAGLICSIVGTVLSMGYMFLIFAAL